MYEKPRENLTQVAQFTRREGGTERKRPKIFSGFYYRVAGGGYFTTFLKQNFENLICDGKLFENFEIREKFRKRF